MHQIMTDLMVEKIKQRHAEGDCPVTPSYSVEKLEFAIIDLASRLANALAEIEYHNRPTPSPDSPVSP